MGSLSFISQSRTLSLCLDISFIFLLYFYLKTSIFPHKTFKQTTITIHSLVSNQIISGCAALHNYTDYRSQCIYVKTHIDCKPKGYINYLQIFYCTCGQFPFLGHTFLLLWLVILFYLLGNTAAKYFCSSLEGLSKILKLPPTIAGITLLSLGNGAPDVFASIFSFTRSNDGNIGLNSILGAAFFVSSGVVGTISTLASSQQISVDKPSFIRDVLFFLFSLCYLLAVILVGKINLWGAIFFVLIYLIYVCAVSGSYVYHRNKEGKNTNQVVVSTVPNNSFFLLRPDDIGEGGTSLSDVVDDEKLILDFKTSLQEDQDQHSPRLFNPDSSFFRYLSSFLNILGLPLYLPRRLTIPVVSEENWSKTYAVISVTLAPFLFVTILNTQIDRDLDSSFSILSSIAAALIGIVLGTLAFLTTNNSSPPQRCLFPWLAGGFLMSVAWTYITAGELVSLLVSLGRILGISPSVLGLTVLAWGNSLGDLIANVAMAIKGGANGAQIAISGCYAGPMFNTLVGLGMSLVLSSSSKYPASYVIPSDPSLYETLGFLMAGLLWALVVLPARSMKLDRFLGLGLLVLYSCFLCLRMARALGIWKLY